MNTTLLALASLSAYAVTGILYGWYLYHRKPRIGQAATGGLLVSLGIHYFALLARSRALHTVPYNDLWGSMSLLAWLLALLYLGLELRYRDRAAGPFVLAIVLGWQAAMVFFGGAPAPSAAGELRGALFAFHITSTMLAYAAFALAFILSALFLLEQRFIRSHHWGRLFWRLPPLDLLERMSSTGIKVGMVALCLGVFTGFLSSQRLLGRAWSGDAKEVWSLLVLLIYAAYLWLRSQAGWQGSRASLLSVVAFGIVLFGYTIVNFFLTHYHTFY